MLPRIPKLFDIQIVDFQAPHLDAVAKLHAQCFPEKIECILGPDCVREVLRRRCLAVQPEVYCRVAVMRSDGRVVGYVLSAPLAEASPWSIPFVTREIALAYLKRRAWRSPRVWAYLLHRVRLKFSGAELNEAGALLQDADPSLEFCKMLGVDPQFRFGNIGFDLMLDIEEHAARRGARRICGLVDGANSTAERLYTAIGWKRASPPERFKIFAMYKDLAPAAGP